MVSLSPIPKAATDWSPQKDVPDRPDRHVVPESACPRERPQRSGPRPYVEIHIRPRCRLLGFAQLTLHPP